MKNTAVKNSAVIVVEIKKFVDKFEKQYGLTPERIEFFNNELPRFAEKVFAEDFDMEKEAKRFVEEYRDVRQCGGFNATYGRLHNWFKDYAAALLRFEDSYDYFCSKM